ncbi:hypothetical protein F5883DRAFT_676660 [Diaporthe sp. PMI_573]|nr:hypothetical protein F5883DRAFT_676660 [Diaporthaceae sp. PMI_573]
MYPMLASRRGGQLANGGGFDGTGSTAAAASRIDLHGMTLGGNPQPVEPGRPVTTSAAFWNAATGSRASAIPASTEALAIFDASSQHAQETPSERESTGGAPAAFSTSAAGTPSGATEHPANERNGTFDDGEDASGREERGTDGKGKNHMEQPMACPYYILNPQLHQGCRYIALWEPSAVTHHIKRSHKQPKTFCPTCLDVFKSQRALDTHRNRLTPCSLVPFDHHWATSEALDKLDKLPKYGRDDTRTKWHAKYKAMFGDTPSRHQIFCFASAPKIWWMSCQKSESHHLT